MLVCLCVCLFMMYSLTLYVTVTVWWLGVNLSAVCHPVHVAGALIIEEPGLHVDMYYRVNPSQIIMLYATMSFYVEHFCHELV